VANRLSVDASTASWQAIAALFQAVAEVTRSQPVYAIVTVPDHLVAQACKMVRAIGCDSEINAIAAGEAGQMTCDRHVNLARSPVSSSEELRDILAST